jgi:hypothetical protein
MHRAHEDQRAAALLRDHPLQARPRGQEAAVQVDGEDPFPVGKRHVGDVVDVLHAGIANQDVDAAELARGLFDAALDLALVADVHAQANRVFQARSGSLGGFAVDIGYAYFRARGGEDARDLGADAAGGAGNERALGFQWHVRILAPRAGNRL